MQERESHCSERHQKTVRILLNDVETNQYNIKQQKQAASVQNSGNRNSSSPLPLASEPSFYFEQRLETR